MYFRLLVLCILDHPANKLRKRAGLASSLDLAAICTLSSGNIFIAPERMLWEKETARDETFGRI